MGKSPHSGGESRFFPDACSGIPERSTERRRRGPERQMVKRERCRVGKRLCTLGRPPKSRGRWAEGTGHMLRPPASGNDRDGQAEGSRQVCSRQQGQALGMTKGCRDWGRRQRGRRPVFGLPRRPGDFAGHRTEESPRRAGAFRSEGGQRQDMTDAAA